MSRFRLSAGGSRAHEPWFRVGTLDIGTTWLVVFISIAGLLAYAVGGISLETRLAFTPDTSWIASHPWTLVTWPFAYVNPSFWDVASIFFIWYFGRDLESSVLGRAKLAWIYLISTLAYAVILWGLVELQPSWGAVLYGLRLLQLSVVVLWTAEWPRRMFMFSIPAWVFGIALVGIQVIQFLGDRSWGYLFSFIGGLAVIGFAARQYGALSEFAWIPRLPGGGPRRPRMRTRKNAQPTVVTGPWQGSSAPTPPPVNRDAQRMDELLDKISAHGTESLTVAERRELEELRLRRRR